MIRLKLVAPNSPPKTFTFDHPAVIIGRSDDCVLPIRDPKASRMHCQIVQTSRGVELVDLGSSNGTQLNGSDCSRQGLSPGDEIRIGFTRILFQDNGDAPLASGDDEMARTPPDAIPVGGAPNKAKGHPASTRSAASGRSASARLAARRSGNPLVPLMVFLAILGGFGVIIYIFILAPDKGKPEPAAAGPLASEEAEDVHSQQWEEFEKQDEKRREEQKRREEEIKRKAEEQWRAEQAQKERYEAEVERRKEKEKEKATRAAAEEEKRKAAEAAARAKRREEQARVYAGEKARFEKLAPEIETLLDGFRFEPALDLLRDFQAEVETEAGMELAVMRSDEINAMAKAFETMWGKIQKYDEIGIHGRTVKVTTTDADGFSGKMGPAFVKYKWSDLEPEDVHPLFDWIGMTAEDYYGAGLLLLELGLQDRGEYLLTRCVDKDPGRKAFLDLLVARYRGIEPPAGGFTIYDDLWITAEEQALVKKGYRRYQGKWMTQEEINKAKGLVKVGGAWMTEEEAEEKKKEDDLIAKIKPKGYINKNGWYDGVPWEEAIVVETKHYRVKSNLKREAVEDAAKIMEWLFWNFCHKFHFFKRMQKFNVWIGGSRQDYMAHGGGHGSALGHCTSSGTISTYYQPPITLLVLMHEGTHQFIFRIAPTCPLWLHEGMATYFECSKFAVDLKTRTLKLRTGLLNRNRCMVIQRDLKNGRAASLDRFVRGKGGDPYSQGWAFVYYMMNAKDGRYTRYWLDFLNDIGKGLKPMKWFRKWLGVYDLEKFEKEWKEYILALDPNRGEDQNIGHK